MKKLNIIGSLKKYLLPNLPYIGVGWFSNKISLVLCYELILIAVCSSWNGGNTVYSFIVNSSRVIAPVVVGFAWDVTPWPMPTFPPISEPEPIYHEITVISPENGRVLVVSPGIGRVNQARGETRVYRIYEGNEVVVTVTPDEGWEIHPGYNGGRAEYRFIVSGDRTIRPRLREIGQDNAPRPVPPIAVGRFLPQFIQGYGDGTARPSGYVTRAEMAQMFFNLSLDTAKYNARMGNTRFADVSTDDWFYVAIAYFVNIGALRGFGDGTFRPNSYITNAEFAAFATYAFNLEHLGIHSTIQENANLGHWAAAYMGLTFDNGWLDFFGIEAVAFNPQTPITRAQAVVLTNHFTGRVPNETLINLNIALGVMQPYTDLPRSHFAFMDIMAASMSKFVEDVE